MAITVRPFLSEHHSHAKCRHLRAFSEEIYCKSCSNYRCNTWSAIAEWQLYVLLVLLFFPEKSYKYSSTGGNCLLLNTADVPADVKDSGAQKLSSNQHWLHPLWIFTEVCLISLGHAVQGAKIAGQTEVSQPVRLLAVNRATNKWIM